MTPADSGIRYIRETGTKKIYRAGWIMADPHTFLENAWLETGNGRISRVSQTRPPGENVTDLGPGLMMPPLVNAHLHLELSALAGRIPFENGFQAWVAALIKEREALGAERLIQKAEEAANALASAGVGVAGEVSTLGITRNLCTEAGLAGVWFHEFLGADIPDHDLSAAWPLSLSLAGHAPHTTHPRLLQQGKAATRTRNLPFAIHVAESDAESRFIEKGKGAWADFLTARGIAYQCWPIGGKTPVRYLDDLNILDRNTLCVHLLNATRSDLEILAGNRSHICLCPRSNQLLHNKLPDLETILALNLVPALGTDSLASCPSLSILDEMAFVRQNWPGVDPATILAMATVNGARALGLADCCGTLAPGKKSDFLYLDLNATNPKDLMESVTYNDF